MNRLRNLFRPKAILSGLLIAATLAMGYGFASQHPAYAAVDCDNNAVIKCGYANLADFKSKFAQNPYGDLQKIYGNWQVDGNKFAAQAKHVTVYKSGEVKLDDGTVVATNANSLGRQDNGANRKPIDIGGKRYYYSQPKDSFSPNSLDGYAMFNADDHSMMLTILKACGNPIWGKSPGYKCQMLKQSKVNENTYKYVATPFTKDGATITKIVYDFGDGKSQTVTSNFGQEVTHTYAPGKFTTRATVYFNVNGKEKSDTRQDCTKPVDVPQPPKPVFACKSLVAIQTPGSRTKFTFTATAEVKDATLKTGTFIFDDGKTVTVNAVGNTVTTPYDYTKEGIHNTSVDLTFDKGADKGNAKCKVVTKTVAETCKDTPEKPECQPPKTCADTPDAPECQPEKNCETNPEMDTCKEIPSTGPVEILGSVLGLSTITGAGAYYHASRRNLIDKLKK